MKHRGDLIRSPGTGKVLIRHPHEKGPCLLEEVERRRNLRALAVATAADARAMERRARADRLAMNAEAALHLRLGVVAAIDAGMTFQEAAEALGVAVGTAHAAYHEQMTMWGLE